MVQAGLHSSGTAPPFLTSSHDKESKSSKNKWTSLVIVPVGRALMSSQSAEANIDEYPPPKRAAAAAILKVWRRAAGSIVLKAGVQLLLLVGNL